MGDRMRTLWIFATVNYLYCDVVTLMDPNRMTGFSPGFLLGAAVLVEIPMAMVVLSRFRWANIGAGALMTVVQLSTLFVHTPALYYVFFSAIEIGTTALIVRQALINKPTVGRL
jgi:Family of unknown function (DUF6326)